MGGSDATANPEAGADAAITTCAGPCLFASSLNHPFLMTSDANNVYWTEYGTAQASADGAVKACPVSGCPASGPIVYASNQSNPQGIAVDAQNIYWGTTGSIFWCPLTGCVKGPQALANPQTPYGVAVGGGYVYWVDQSDQSVHRALAPNGTDEVLYNGSDVAFVFPEQCAVDSQYLYLTDDYADVFRVPVTGGEPTQIAQGTESGGWPVALDTAAVYYGQIGGIYRALKTSTKGGIAINTTVQDVDGLYADSTGYIYWSDWGSSTANDGTVGKVLSDGGMATVLASSLVTPEAVTVSGPYVFWLSNGTLDTKTSAGEPNSGALYRLPK